MKFAVILSTTLLLLSICEAQRSRGRSRGRSRSRGDSQCHLKEVDSCIDKIQALTKGPNPTGLIATSEGLDKICGTFNDVVKCVKGFIKKCGTPLQRELFDFGAEYFVQTFKQFCDPGPIRETFLKNSPCINTNVLTSNQYKASCNNNFLASIEYVMTRNNTDDRLDTMCCGQNTWEDCTENLIVQSCGEEGKKSFRSFLSRSFGGLTTLLCPRTVFPPTGNICKKALPPKGTRPRGKSNDNPIAKYITNYFSFLLTTK